MSELKVMLTDIYNGMSHSNLYSEGYLSGYRQCVVDVEIIKEQLQPTLIECQEKELTKMKNKYTWFGKSLEHGLFDYITEGDYTGLTNKEFA